MDIGRKIVFDKTTSEILFATGEKTVPDDFEEESINDIFPAYHESTMALIELPFGERTAEFMSMGSYEIVEGQVVINPLIKVTSDKALIEGDGIDFATIKAVVNNDVPVTFKVVDSTSVITPVNGIATFELSSSLVGNYEVTASADKFGTASVFLEVT